MDKNAFSAWAENYGRARLARDMNVTWASVHNWTTGKCLPRPELAYKLIELSKGELSLEDIYPKEPNHG